MAKRSRTAPGLAGKIVDGVRLKSADLAVATIAALFFTGWAAMTEGTFSLRRLAFFASLAYGIVATGDVILRFGHRFWDPGWVPDPLTKFLVGLLSAASLLYICAWISPLHIQYNAAILFVGVVAAKSFVPRVETELGGARSESVASSIAVLLGMIAATLWCRESMSGVVTTESGVIFKPWVDSFVHAAEIRVFRDAHGRIADIHMSGANASFYHFAGYLLPALVSAVASMTPYQAFVCFFLPTSILCAVLAGYVLVRSWWGGWAGLTAAFGLAVLPDAAQQGIGNHFFSYHWILQTSPSLGYGIALVSLAWGTAMAAMRTGRRGVLFLAFALEGWAIHFKAQLFIASAPLLVTYAAIFMRGLKTRRRILYLLAIAAGVYGTILISKYLPTVPEIRFDAASTTAYLEMVRDGFEGGAWSHCFAGIGPQSTWKHDVGLGGLMLLLVTLGGFGPLYLLLAVGLRRLPAVQLVFPAALTVNYLAMSLMLAMDRRGVGTPEELLHRPFVWVYFGTVAWIGGGAFLWATRRWSANFGGWRLILATAGVALLSIPWKLGRSVRRGPRWGSEFVDQKIPSGLIRAAAFLRVEARQDDVVQDSGGDSRLVVTALSERQAFVIDYFLRKPDPAIAARLEALRHFRDLSDENQIREFALTQGIRWFVSHPQDQLGWPTAMLEQPVFASDGYRVYRLY